MSDKIDKHPSIIFQNEIADICEPLNKLNISYFTHVNIHNQEFSAITNHPQFHSHYLHKKYYNADIHMAQEGLIKDYFLWDLVEQFGENNQMEQDAVSFGVRHTFTILEKNKYGDNYYHFGTHLPQQSFNQVYLSNLDILKLFVMHFNSCVSQSKPLSSAYQIKFSLDENSGGFQFNNKIIHDNELDVRQSIINDLNIGETICLKNGKTLSMRQIKILFWLHQGKTVDDISQILGIATVTVNKHIAEIKYKVGCYTHFQLGELFAELFGFSSELMGIIAK